MTRTHALRRTLTTATAAISALALAVPGAGAAASGPEVFSASSEALALQLELTGPLEVLGPVTGGGNTLVQKVSLTSSALDSAGKAVASTKLLDGLHTSGVLDSGEGGTTGSDAIVAQDLGLVSVGAGTVEYVADPAQNLASSRSELARLTVSLAPLFSTESLLPPEVAEQLRGTVDTATEVVDELVGDLNDVLDGIEGTVNETVAETTGEVVDLPVVSSSDLPVSVPDLTEADLLDVRKLWSETVNTTKGDAVRSLAHGGIAEASLLGGLVQVPAFEYTSWAETDGTTADAGYDITTIAVRVGETEVKVSGTTLEVGDIVLDLGTPELAEAAAALVDVEDILGSLMNAGGLSVTQGQGTREVAEDGSSAKASTSAFAISLAPLNAASDVLGEDQLRVELAALPTVAAVSAGVAPAPAAPQSAPAMPKTGGGALAVVLGSLSIAGAGLLRKRA